MENEKKEVKEIKEPVIKKTAVHLTPEANVSLKIGEAFVVQTDSNGQEIPGTGFKTSLKTFEKSFAHLNFKLKKKA